MHRLMVAAVEPVERLWRGARSCWFLRTVELVSSSVSFSFWVRISYCSKLSVSCKYLFRGRTGVSEFTHENLITALNEMVHEYRKLSQTFEEIKTENGCLKNSSAEPSTAQLGETGSLQTEFIKLKIENDSLRTKSCELSFENDRLNQVMSSWTQSSISLSKLHEIQKPLNDKTGLGFSFCESSSEETCTQSDLVDEKFKKMSFVKASVIHDVYESVKYDDQITGQLNQKDKNGIGYIKSENCKSIWLTNRLEKEKAKAVPKSSVLN
ncbi:hypothetical protein F511_24785 [Dorcoceras hygrometricum]|uniref:Uncharacterized protein n=1 Tax=Dorcoceras hygrometricum TaxID=472368 RepID=A0A2Z7AB58_9LAMI|nr:hypothetical protein F511_24785 [Dorcoceras hygrometricum]